MLESIDRAGAIGWGTIITVIALAIFLIPNAIEGWNRFLKSIGLVKKKSLQEAQREKEIAEIYEKINRVQEDIIGKQEEYHLQSIHIRGNLADDQAELRNEQKEIRKDVKQMSDILQDYIRKDDKKTIATLRTTLWQLHKGFMDQGYVTPDGLKTFTELGKVYEDAGGDDIYHDKLVPEVMSLEIRYPDGSIYKKG
ncbi:hypothetical protein [Eisenbergiella porci]|uniref:hypothetical protein n=1 Tax=Eisenbergiella porci TaxID=2652274 RepID=UPI002A836F0F|nr:hypothetical protein [Eisenbergiella porci]